MGWKAFTLFATDQPSGYFGSFPQHDPERAEAIRIRLGLDRYEIKGKSTFEQGIYPQNGSLFIGAYPGGTILCEEDLPFDFFDEISEKTHVPGVERRNFRSNFLNLYPAGQVLAIVLHSVVDLWGYSLYSKGKWIRAATGSSDDGLIGQFGQPLPEEERILRECPIEKVHEEGIGEELVFDVSTRFLGKRIDAFDEFNLQMTEYQKQVSCPFSFFKRLFGRK